MKTNLMKLNLINNSYFFLSNLKNITAFAQNKSVVLIFLLILKKLYFQKFSPLIRHLNRRFLGLLCSFLLSPLSSRLFRFDCNKSDDKMHDLESQVNLNLI